MRKPMSKASNHQQLIASQFELRPILYIPGLAHLFGLNEAILLSQLLYWDGKGQYKNWTYKTLDELKYETGLTRSRQDSAIRHLKKLGVIEVVNRGVPMTRHFRVDVDKLQEVIVSLLETNKLKHLKPATKSAEIKQTITETTQDTTTETTLYSAKKDFGTVEVFEDFFSRNEQKDIYDI